MSIKGEPAPSTTWRSLRNRSAIRLSLGLLLTAAGWSIMWGVDTYFNAFAFWSLWTGASLLAWTLGKTEYPGFRIHLQLAFLSVPLWWWFELINERVQNWHYVLSFDYGPVQYGLLTSVAFSTVVPAICAASSMIRRGSPQQEPRGLQRSGNRRLAIALIATGAVLQVAVVLFPTQLFPLVWVAPALVFDGLVASAGGRSLVRDLASGRWTDVLVIAAGGLICGFFWSSGITGPCPSGNTGFRTSTFGRSSRCRRRDIWATSRLHGRSSSWCGGWTAFRSGRAAG